MTVLTLVEAAKNTAADRLGCCRRAVARWVARSRQRRTLNEIAECGDLHLLKDIGITQDEAFRESGKPFWRR